MNKRTSSIALLCVSLGAACAAQARDDRQMLPIAAAMESKAAQEKLDGSVRFFFGSQEHPAVLTGLGSEIVDRTANAFAKSDSKACNEAFLFVMAELQKEAISLGANAVIEIVSDYKKNEVSSATEFECHAGSFVVGVALKGQFAKIADK